MSRPFPKIPNLKAAWAPVYIEPIMHSGERFTVGIAATAANGETTVVPTISEKQLSCILGELDGSSFFNIVQLTLDSLSEHLKESHSLLSWESPFSGVVLGPNRETVGDSILSVVQLAMRLTSTFSATLVKSQQVPDVDALAARAVEDDRWPKRIYEAVVRQNPDFSQYFNRAVPIKQGFPPSKFDFMGRHYVANFGRLIPSSRSLSRLRNTAKARLWDLAHLRDAAGVKGNITALELILWQPRPDDMAYSDNEMHALKETIFELSEEAKKQELKTIPVYTAEEASNQILLQEAA